MDDEEQQDVTEIEEQFLLEPVDYGKEYVLVNTRLDYQYRSKNLNDVCLYEFVSGYHKRLADQSDHRILKETSALEGERLSIKGTKMNERHTFHRMHPQSSSHIIIKRSTPAVPVLLGPQIPRHDREETRERYCRALLTLFVPWRSVQDLCHYEQRWSEAFECRKSMISPNGYKIIENIQLLHECRKDRDEHLLQVINEAEIDPKFDPILLPNCPMGNDDNDEDRAGELLQMIDFVNEDTMVACLAPANTREQRYINDALHSIENTDRFAHLTSEFALRFTFSLMLCHRSYIRVKHKLFRHYELSMHIRGMYFGSYYI